MTAVPLLLILHNHQPVGNFSWVTEECYHTAYEPFLTVLERHPGVRVGLHFTGPLLEWLRAERPEYLSRVQAHVQAGQVEVLGGGFYEPILPVIPEHDRIGQLQMLRTWVTELFGRAPTGAWLAERVWEPGLPMALQAGGVEYVLVDDEIFHRQGYSPQQTCTTFITEDAGATVRLMPISRRLRYTIPTAPVPTILDTLRAMASEGAEVLIYAEDGERFGNWPGTYDYLYGEEAYLEQLFTALEETDEVKCVLPGDYMRASAPASRIYLPPASYQEMLEWSGGFWRNFLARYRESNLMHKKMLQVSRWAQSMTACDPVAGAHQHLYAAQCNCAYWYGAFGGLYLPHLRRAVYHHLLLAERALLPSLSPQARPTEAQYDYDCDGRDELILRDGEITIGIAPAQGGGVFALEHLGLAHTFLNTMGRYPLRDTEGEGQPPVPVDWYPRLAFLDHILAADAVPEQMHDGSFQERGDFVLGAYASSFADEGGVLLQRDGGFWDGPVFAPLRVCKQYRLMEERLQVAYTVTNPSKTERTLRFAVEVNVSLTAGDAPGRYLQVQAAAGPRQVMPESTNAVTNADGVEFCDEWLGTALAIRWSQPATAWTFPVQTPLCSLEGQEWVYQSTIAMPVWALTLPPGCTWQTVLTVDVVTIAPSKAE